MTFTVDAISVPVKTGNNWIDSLLRTSEDSDAPGLYLQVLTAKFSFEPSVGYESGRLPLRLNKTQDLIQGYNFVAAIDSFRCDILC